MPGLRGSGFTGWHGSLRTGVSLDQPRLKLWGAGNLAPRHR